LKFLVISDLNVKFKDPAILKAIDEKGFFIDSFLNPAEIRQLQESFQALAARAEGSIGKSFWPSGRHPDADIRNFAKQEIEKIVPGKLREYVDAGSTTFIGGTFLIKPSSDQSALNPHQDSSHVDERHGFSVYAWIPLMDTDEVNGCMYYLPGSQHWGIDQRSLNVPWPLSEIELELWPLMVPIPMKAGQVLFFHSALIHASSNNLSGQTRLALNYYLHPKQSPFCHFYTDETMEKGKVAMYSVTPDFYYSEDFESRPNEEKYPLLEVMDISKFDRSRVLALIGAETKVGRV
jgi:hypothetical protein